MNVSQLSSLVSHVKQFDAVQSDLDFTSQLLRRPLWMEMGLRDAYHLGQSVLVLTVGMGASTSQLVVWVTAMDLYQFQIVKVRSGKVKVLAEQDMVYAEDLASTILLNWSKVCEDMRW